MTSRWSVWFLGFLWALAFGFMGANRQWGFTELDLNLPILWATLIFSAPFVIHICAHNKPKTLRPLTATGVFISLSLFIPLTTLLSMAREVVGTPDTPFDGLVSVINSMGAWAIPVFVSVGAILALSLAWMSPHLTHPTRATISRPRYRTDY